MTLMTPTCVPCTALPEDSLISSTNDHIHKYSIFLYLRIPVIKVFSILPYFDKISRFSLHRRHDICDLVDCLLARLPNKYGLVIEFGRFINKNMLFHLHIDHLSVIRFSKKETHDDIYRRSSSYES